MTIPSVSSRRTKVEMRTHSAFSNLLSFGVSQPSLASPLLPVAPKFKKGNHTSEIQREDVPPCPVAGDQAPGTGKTLALSFYTTPGQSPQRLAVSRMRHLWGCIAAYATKHSTYFPGSVSGMWSLDTFKLLPPRHWTWLLFMTITDQCPTMVTKTNPYGICNNCRSYVGKCLCVYIYICVRERELS
jgi:hypothetical protein